MLPSLLGRLLLALLGLLGEQRVVLQAVRAHLALRQERPAVAAARERACMERVWMLVE